MLKRKKLISLVCSFVLAATAILSTAAVSYGASDTEYWLKVNAQANVVTVYKNVDGEWEPVRAMLCSTGTGKKGTTNATPTGTYYTQGRWDWGAMVGNVYARYVVQFYGDYLFHSVPYNERYDKTSQPTKEFNKLGKDASHGCVRLSTMDARWVYNNCYYGTKVTIYNSSNPGPLGKPEGIKVDTNRETYWDPTDPDANNPYYLIKMPEIDFGDKDFTVQYGSSFKLKDDITVQDPNTFYDLTHLLKVSKIKYYDTTQKKYVDANFSVMKLGTYKVTYKVTYKYSGTTTETVKIKVVDNLKAPTISGAKNHAVTVGDTNAVKGITASQATGDRTEAIVTWIKEPDTTKYKAYTYEEAKGYVFEKKGMYLVKYTVKNKYSPYKEAKRTIVVAARTE